MNNENNFTPLWQVLGIKPNMGEIQKGKINFDKWEDREEFYESWDDPEYFKELFESDTERVYSFKVYLDKEDGLWMCEIVDEEDETEGTIFYKKEIIFI